MRLIDADKIADLFIEMCKVKMEKYFDIMTVLAIAKILKDPKLVPTVNSTMLDERQIELMEENEKMREALADLIYLCETSDKAIDCMSDEFVRIKMIANE